jgi:hypothetical protein
LLNFGAFLFLTSSDPWSRLRFLLDPSKEDIGQELTLRNAENDSEEYCNSMRKIMAARALTKFMSMPLVSESIPLIDAMAQVLSAGMLGDCQFMRPTTSSKELLMYKSHSSDTASRSL